MEMFHSNSATEYRVFYQRDIASSNYHNFFQFSFDSIRVSQTVACHGVRVNAADTQSVEDSFLPKPGLFLVN